MNKVYLLIGGNVGNRLENLALAAKLIAQSCGKITKKSQVYETAAWGKTEQPSFLNQAFEVKSPMSAETLMQTLLILEEQMGRKRGVKYGPRIIDMDILLFNHEIIRSALISVPHPEMEFRRFALLPLAELIPDYIHPVLQLSIRELLKHCADQLPVNVFPNTINQQ